MIYTASSAANFIASLGVNTHLSWTSTPYGNLTAVENDLSYLGLHAIRDNVANTTQELNALSALAAMGVKVDMIANSDLTGFMNLANNLEKAHPGSILAVEGLNEVSPGSTSAAQLQQTLFNDVKGDSLMAGVSIYNLSLAGPKQFGSSLAAYATDANAHIYYGGGQPAYGWSANDSTYYYSTYLNAAKANAPGEPVVVTETGATTAVGNQTSVGVDQATQAKQILNSFMDGAKNGVAMTYIYELMDSRNNGASDSESHFGLYNWDGTPKLAATAIHNFTSILTSHGALSGTPGALDYTISGVPQWGGQMLYQQGDGTYDLVVWAEPDVWNESNSTPITAPNTPITLSLANAAGVSIYDPMTGTSAVQSLGSTSQVAFNVTDHPLIIQISPGSSGGSTGGGSTGGSSSTTPPSAPAALALTAASDAGRSSSDGITNDTTPTVTGAAAAGATVTLLDGTTKVGTATADTSGHWTITSSTLADGAHSLTATAANAGGTSAASGALTVTIDTHAPSAPSTPVMTGGASTSVATPTFTGSVLNAANALVTLYDGSKAIGSATVDSSGNWSITSSALAVGAHAITATATDVAGNVSALSGADAVTIVATAGSSTSGSSTTSPSTGVTGQTYTSDNNGDHWVGTAGNDTFNLGRGGDVVTGNGGNDTFKFAEAAWSPGHITDFNAADVLDISGLFQHYGYTGSSPLSDGHLKFVSDGAGGTQVWANLDGLPVGTGGNWMVTDLDHIDPSSLSIANGLITEGGSSSTPSASGQTFTTGNTASVVVGTSGNDVFNLGRDGDRVTGNGGNDTFKFAEVPWNPAHITDFHSGDVMDLSQMFQHYGYTGSSPASDGHLKFVSDGAGGTQVWANLDGLPIGSGGNWYVADLEHFAPSSVHVNGAFITG